MTQLVNCESYDCVVVGAGPAGCAAAAVAARAGLRVLLVERDPAPKFKVGESMMPETYWALEEMGVLERMKQSHFVHKHSVQFYARSGRASAPFYFQDEKDHACSQTWQVHREEFDQLLFENAGDQGAECHRGLAVKDLHFEGDPESSPLSGVTLESETLGKQQVRCKVLLDATGQSTLLGRFIELGKQDYGLRNASIFTHFKGAFRDPGRDEGATLILQTVPEGDTWFWYIPLAHDVVSVGLVGEAKNLKRPGNRPHETFFEEVERCPEIKRRIAGAVQCRPVDMVKDFSYRYEKMAGDGWVLLGDAFSFIDPVYSSGIFLALFSGVMAAQSTAEAIQAGDVSAAKLSEFQPRLNRGTDAIRSLVEAFYNKNFSFGRFLKQYPHHQSGVTRILIGDVFDQPFDDLFSDMSTFLAEA